MKRILTILCLGVLLGASTPALTRGHGTLLTGGSLTPVQIVLCMVHAPGATKESGLDVEFMNISNQGYLHVNKFSADGSYTVRSTPAQPALIFGTTMGSIGGGTATMPALVRVQTTRKSHGHSGVATFAGGSFRWVCP